MIGYRGRVYTEIPLEGHAPEELHHMDHLVPLEVALEVVLLIVQAYWASVQRLLTMPLSQIQA